MASGDTLLIFTPLHNEPPAAERLLAAGSLSSSQAVTSGNTFTLTEFTIRIPDPA